jgi:hypothetical protein
MESTGTLETEKQTELFKSDVLEGLASEETSVSAEPVVAASKTEKEVDLVMGASRVRVKTDTTPLLLKQIRELVEARYEVFASKAVKGISAPQLSVLVAYSLAEELLKEKDKLRQAKRRIAECTERLIDRVESQLRKDSGA